MANLTTSPSRQVFAPVMVELAATPFATVPDTDAASRSPIAEPDAVITYGAPVMAVPAMDVVIVASAVERTLPSIEPTSVMRPLKGARNTALAAVRLAALQDTTASGSGW